MARKRTVLLTVVPTVALFVAALWWSGPPAAPAMVAAVRAAPGAALDPAALPRPRRPTVLPLDAVPDRVPGWKGAPVEEGTAEEARAREDACRSALGLASRRDGRRDRRRGECAAAAEPQLGRDASHARLGRMHVPALNWTGESLLEMEHVTVDFGRITFKQTPLEDGRPQYEAGAVSLLCTPDAGLRRSMNPSEDNGGSMHQTETMMATGLAVHDGADKLSACTGADLFVQRTTVVVSRASVAGSQFHNMLEPIGVFLAAVSSSLTNATDDFQVLLLDDHHDHPGNLLPVFEALSRYPVLSASRFAGKRVCFDRLVYAVSGWQTYFYQPERVEQREPCLVPSAALLSFRTRVLWGMGFLPSLEPITVTKRAACLPEAGLSSGRVNGPGPTTLLRRLRLVYIGRTNARVVDNEEELMTVFASVAEQVDVLTVHFALNQTLHEQIALIRSADIVVSPHGAALVNIIFARAGTAVIELFPRSHQHVQLYRNLAAFTCLSYRAVSSWSDTDVDTVHVTQASLLPVLHAVISELGGSRGAS